MIRRHRPAPGPGTASSVRSVVSSIRPGILVAAAAGMMFVPAGMRSVAAADATPTVFQAAIRSWMGVVALVADDGESEKGEQGETKKDDARGERRGRRERRDGEAVGPRRPGMPPHMKMPPRPGMSSRSGQWDRGGRGPGGMTPDMGMGPMPGMRSDASATLREIAERLSRIERKLDTSPRVANPWSPRPESSRSGRPPRPEMSDEFRRTIEQRMGEGRARMAEARERMEQARKKFQEMEERIRTLEAEVERLKAGK